MKCASRLAMCGMCAILLAAMPTIDCRAQENDARIVTLETAEIATIVQGRLQATKTIKLPLHWDVSYPSQSGIAILKFSFARPPDSKDVNEPYMFFMMRIANAYAIDLNGTVLASEGDLRDFGGRWSSKQPVGITFPASLLTESNTLTIRLRGDGARRAGVAPIFLGPAQQVEPMRSKAYALRVVVTMACAMFSLLVSGFCLLLWLQQREKLYAWACIGEAIWAVVVADVILESLPLRWPAWVLALVTLRAVWIWALYIIVEQVFGARPRSERWIMKILAIFAPISLVLSPALSSPLPFLIWRGTTSLMIVVLLVRLLIGPRKSTNPERLLLWLGIATLLAAGTHDAIASALFSSQYGDAVWAKYAGSFLGVTIMWIVSKRFRQARAEALQLNASLAQRVEQKELELRDSFVRLSEAERSRAVIAERERILRDMHDGVGANLATAMRQLESGTAPAKEVAETLRESLDHLKLSIDAMNLPTGDVNALLASLRYRLQPRIESAGLTLEWQVDLLPYWDQGTDQAMRDFQFLLLEAISNALQHASASTLTLSAHATEAHIEIVLRDNGKGFDNEPGRGLQSMRERAKAIGAQLLIEPATPGTRVCVLLPTDYSSISPDRNASNVSSD